MRYLDDEHLLGLLLGKEICHYTKGWSESSIVLLNILGETDEKGALNVAQVIRAGVAKLSIPHSGSLISNHITASMGV